MSLDVKREAQLQPASQRIGAIKKIRKFLKSSAIVGAMALLGGILSTAQLLSPIIYKYFSSYEVEFESPDTLNLFCEGSEGIDAPKLVNCGDRSRLVVLATPLFYINKGTEEKTVWLRREVVRIRLLDEHFNTIETFALTAERVAETDRWHAPPVQQIEGGKAISHQTLYYPQSYGCEDKRIGNDCLRENSFVWKRFADELVSGKVTQAILSFEPVFKGPVSIEPQACLWAFNNADVGSLRIWQKQLEAAKKAGPEPFPDGTISPQYLSANCVPLSEPPRPR